MKVALCQIEVGCGDREGNLARMDAALQTALTLMADLAVFPESAILGWINPEAHRQADPIPGADTDRLCELARRHGIAIVAGIDEKGNDLLYDSAVAIGEDGSLLGVHRKANVLPELMDPPYATGDRGVTVVDFSFGRVGILICADTFDDEAIASAKEANIDLLAAPYGWVASDDSWPGHGASLQDLICRRARELGCPVVGVDALGTIGHGPWKGRRCCGASLAADRDGVPLTTLQLTKPHVTVVECPRRQASS